MTSKNTQKSWLTKIYDREPPSSQLHSNSVSSNRARRSSSPPPRISTSSYILSDSDSPGSYGSYSSEEYTTQGGETFSHDTEGENNSSGSKHAFLKSLHNNPSSSSSDNAFSHGILSQVHKMHSLMEEYQQSLTTFELEKTDNQQEINNLTRRLKAKGETEEKFKEDIWNLELKNQDLKVKVEELNGQCCKYEADNRQLEKAKTILTQDLEHLRAEQQTWEQKSKSTQAHYEKDILLLKKTIHSGKTDRENLLAQLEELKNQQTTINPALAALKNLRPITTNEQPGEIQHLEKKTEKLPLNPPSFVNFENSNTYSNVVTEVETLKQSLEQAHGIIQTMQEKLDKEKENRSEVDMLLREAQETIENFNQLSHNDSSQWFSNQHQLQSMDSDNEGLHFASSFPALSEYLDNSFDIQQNQAEESPKAPLSGRNSRKKFAASKSSFVGRGQALCDELSLAGSSGTFGFSVAADPSRTESPQLTMPNVDTVITEKQDKEMPPLPESDKIAAPTLKNNIVVRAQMEEEINSKESPKEFLPIIQNSAIQISNSDSIEAIPFSLPNIETTSLASVVFDSDVALFSQSSPTKSIKLTDIKNSVQQIEPSVVSTPNKQTISPYLDDKTDIPFMPIDSVPIPPKTTESTKPSVQFADKVFSDKQVSTTFINHIATNHIVDTLLNTVIEPSSFTSSMMYSMNTETDHDAAPYNDYDATQSAGPMAGKVHASVSVESDVNVGVKTVIEVAHISTARPDVEPSVGASLEIFADISTEAIGKTIVETNVDNTAETIVGPSAEFTTETIVESVIEPTAASPTLIDLESSVLPLVEVPSLQINTTAVGEPIVPETPRVAVPPVELSLVLLPSMSNHSAHTPSIDDLSVNDYRVEEEDEEDLVEEITVISPQKLSHYGSLLKKPESYFYQSRRELEEEIKKQKRAATTALLASNTKDNILTSKMKRSDKMGQQRRSEEMVDDKSVTALTRTMVGDWMWKYTRKVVGGGISENNRHRRFFWIYPYTQTLYWSSKEPGSNGRQSNTKSALVESFEILEDDTETDKSIPPSIYIKTCSRGLKIQCMNTVAHDAWVKSLQFLLDDSKVDDKDQSKTKELGSVSKQHFIERKLSLHKQSSKRRNNMNPPITLALDDLMPLPSPTTFTL